MHVWKIISFGLIFLCGTVFSQSHGPFQQDPSPDGVISMEAEHFHSSTTNSGFSWVLTDHPAASGDMGMVAEPNLGTNFNEHFVLNSPRLDYQVQFDRSGTHFVVIRGRGFTWQDDSVHVGLNNSFVSSADRIGYFPSSFTWVNDTFDGAVATIDIPSPGVHTVNVWMREDGFFMDKLVLSTNEFFLPVGDGPPESSSGASGAAEDNVQEPYFSSIRIEDGMVYATVTPVPGVESVEVMYCDALDQTPFPETNGYWFGYEFVSPMMSEGTRFWSVEVSPMTATQQLSAAVLNRLTYGPTPELVSRVLTGPSAIGPDAYLAEQLAPETVVETVDADPDVVVLQELLDLGVAELDDLIAWVTLRGISADRQFLEIMSQFVNNHFVTYSPKVSWWFEGQGYSYPQARAWAAELEYRELMKWRDVLLNPNGTFYDLLRISCESPAMIIYLDTITNIKTAPNENFAREIMELFSMGVDNGYDYNDIVELSKFWTGWGLAQVHPAMMDDAHAAPMTSPVSYLPRESTGWWYFEGWESPPADWYTDTFVLGTNWYTGQAGIGFGDGDDNTVVTNMYSNYSTIYARKEFVLTNLSEVAYMKLKLLMDDGAVVYLNGSELARFNAPTGTLDHTAVANTSSQEGLWVTVANDLSSDLVLGTNLLAIHGLNQHKWNGDFSMDAELVVEGEWAFHFEPTDHDFTNKTLFASKSTNSRFGPGLGNVPYELVIPVRSGTNGVQDGYDVIEHLSELPYTAEYISVKLCQLLINEEFAVGSYFNITNTTPEAQLIGECLNAWFTPGPDGRIGNLRQVLNVIVGSDLFNSHAAAAQKIKTPLEYVLSAIRIQRSQNGDGSFTAYTDGYGLDTPMRLMGMELFQRGPPDGWPEFGADWIDTGTINERLRFVQNLMMASDDPLKEEDYGFWNTTGNHSDPVQLLQNELPPSALTNALAISEWMLDLVYLGEGGPNTELLLEECLALLNSDETGVPDSSPFGSLIVGSTPYDQRVRSLIGLILADPRFHEQ